MAPACRDHDAPKPGAGQALCPSGEPSTRRLTARPNSDTVLVTGPDRIAVVQPTGAVAWRYRLPEGERVAAAPRVARDSSIYLASNARLYRLSSKGALRFKVVLPFEARLSLQPALDTMADSTAVVSDGDRTVAHVDAEGQLSWRFVLPGRDTLVAPPEVAPGGQVYLRGQSRLYGLSRRGKMLFQLPLRTLRSGAP